MLIEGIIRGWGKTTLSTDAFSLLRVLNLCSQKDITASVFAHLNLFPALSVFNVEDCNLLAQFRQAARNYGWGYWAGKDLGDWFLKSGATGTIWNLILHASFQLGGAIGKEVFKAKDVEKINNIPVFHMCVGDMQADAMVDEIGDRSLRSFYRERIDAARPMETRSSSQTVAPSFRVFHKMSTFRASKRQKLDEFLTGFSG